MLAKMWIFASYSMILMDDHIYTSEIKIYAK